MYDINELNTKLEELNVKITKIERANPKSKEELLKIKAEAQEIISRIRLERKKEENIRIQENKSKLLDSIFVLSIVMSKGIPITGLSESQRPLFDEDDLIPYKAKMLELIKRL